MTETLLAREGLVRLAFFVALLIVLGSVELLIPRRRATSRRGTRWVGNLGLSVINSLAVRLCFPILALGLAEIASHRGWGLFNNLEAPYVVAFALSLVAMDFVIYLQHRIFHAIPLLWRIHRVHHSDVDLDVSSAVRFHFVEILLSMGIKLCLVGALGPPVLAVLAFEIWLNATSMFHHSNLRIAPAVDRVLRWLVVTPDMHRIHHSILTEETDSNFSFNLPWWDRLLGTYRERPQAGHEEMTLGVESFRGRRDQHLDRLLVQPLRTSAPAPPPSTLADRGKPHS